MWQTQIIARRQGAYNISLPVLSTAGTASLHKSNNGKHACVEEDRVRFARSAAVCSRRTARALPEGSFLCLRLNSCNASPSKSLISFNAHDAHGETWKSVRQLYCTSQLALRA